MINGFQREMQERLKKAFFSIFCATLGVLLVTTSVAAQVVPQQAMPIPSPAVQPSPSPSSSPSPEARPLYGVQGVLVETLDGRVVSSQAAFDTFNPASAIKLATALVALETLGPA